jgi:hypothetical protein
MFQTVNISTSGSTSPISNSTDYENFYLSNHFLVGKRLSEVLKDSLLLNNSFLHH